MKKVFMTGIMILALIQAIYAEPRLDSVSLDPSYIEAGDTLDMYIKFHEHPVRREGLSAGTRGTSGTKTVSGEDLNVFYTAKLIPSDDLSEKYIIIHEGEKDIGHVFMGESWTSPFEVKIRDDAPATTYKMEFQIIKTDINGNKPELVMTNDIGIPVKDSVEFDVFSDNTISIGSTHDIKITISNKGGGTARHVNVELALDAPFKTATSSSKYLGNFNAGQSKDVAFSVSVDSDAEVETHEIPLKITYLDRDGVLNTVPKMIGARINAKPDLSIGLDDADTFTPGGEGNVVLGISNEGFIDAKFLKFKLLPSENYQVISINEVYIGNLDSDDVETEEMTIKVNENAPTGQIELNVEVHYKGEGSNEGHVLTGKIPLKIISNAEYAAKHPKTNGQDQAMMAVIAIPAVIVGFLILWFIYKITTLIMNKINKKLFSKKI